MRSRRQAQLEYSVGRHRGVWCTALPGDDADNFSAVDISIPAAVTVFPGGIHRAAQPRERSHHRLVYFNEVDKGGHFAAWERPELFAETTKAVVMRPVAGGASRGRGPAHDRPWPG